MLLKLQALLLACIFSAPNIAIGQQNATARDKSSSINASGNSSVTINQTDPKLMKLAQNLLKAFLKSEAKRLALENQAHQSRKEKEALSEKNKQLLLQGLETVASESLKSNPNALAKQAQIELSEGRTETASRLLVQLAEAQGSAGLSQIKAAAEHAKQAGALQINTNINQAIAAYELALKLLPNDLVVLDTLAHLYLRIDNIDGAFKAANGFLSICLERHLSQPANKQYLRDLSMSYDNLADIQVRRDPELALVNYEKSLELRKKLVNQSHVDIQTPRIQLNGFGVADNHSLDLRPKLLKHELQIKQDLRNLALSLDNVADIQQSENRNREVALANYLKSLEIRKKLSEDDVDNKIHQFDMVVSYYKLGLLYFKASNKLQALSLLPRAISILEKLKIKNPLTYEQNQWIATIQQLIELVEIDL